MMPGGLIVIDEKIQWGETSALFDFAKNHSLKIKRHNGMQVPMTIEIL